MEVGVAIEVTVTLFLIEVLAEDFPLLFGLLDSMEEFVFVGKLNKCKLKNETNSMLLQ